LFLLLNWHASNMGVFYFTRGHRSISVLAKSTANEQFKFIIRSAGLMSNCCNIHHTSNTQFSCLSIAYISPVLYILNMQIIKKIGWAWQGAIGIYSIFFATLLATFFAMFFPHSVSFTECHQNLANIFLYLFSVGIFSAVFIIIVYYNL